MMKARIQTYHIDEKELNQKIESGVINPVHIPEIVTLYDVVKYQRS